jgi:hypothetical protein
MFPREFGLVSDVEQLGSIRYVIDTIVCGVTVAYRAVGSSAVRVGGDDHPAVVVRIADLSDPVCNRASQVIKVDILWAAAGTLVITGYYGMTAHGLDRAITGEGKGICVSYTGEGSERDNCESGGDKGLVHLSLQV